MATMSRVLASTASNYDPTNPETGELPLFSADLV